MYEINDKLNHFIKLVSDLYAFSDSKDILKYREVTLSYVDEDRKEDIKRGITGLIKLYKNEEGNNLILNDYEKRNLEYYNYDKFMSQQYTMYLSVLDESVDTLYSSSHLKNDESFNNSKFIRESNVDFDSDDLIIYKEPKKRLVQKIKRLKS